MTGARLTNSCEQGTRAASQGRPAVVTNTRHRRPSHGRVRRPPPSSRSTSTRLDVTANPLECVKAASARRPSRNGKHSSRLGLMERGREDSRTDVFITGDTAMCAHALTLVHGAAGGTRYLPGHLPGRAPCGGQSHRCVPHASPAELQEGGFLTAEPGDRAHSPAAPTARSGLAGRTPRSPGPAWPPPPTRTGSRPPPTARPSPQPPPRAALSLP